jgi:hypothetical protein
MFKYCLRLTTQKLLYIVQHQYDSTRHNNCCIVFYKGIAPQSEMYLALHLSVRCSGI